MRSPALWTLGLAGSLTAHAALAAVLVLSVDPQEVPPQQPVETRMNLAAYRVPQSEAAAGDADGEAVPQTQATGPAAAQGAVPQSRAEPASLPHSTVAAATAASSNVLESVTVPDAVAAAPVPQESNRLSGATPEGSALAPLESPAAAVLPPTAAAAAEIVPSLPGAAAVNASTALPADSLATAALPSDAATATPVSPASLASSALPSPATPPAAALPAPALAVRPVAAPAAPVVTGAGITLASARIPTTAAAPTAAQTTAAAQAPAPAPAAAAPDLPATAATLAEPDAPGAANLPPPATFATASLAWSGAGGAPLDPASLAAIEAFMQPGDPSAAAQEARDGIQALLAAVPCARLQTEFIPETGALELRGHIPEDGMRAPVLAALQTEVGASLPVADNLLILPRPQCGALAGIADVGLPQSTDQLTNPRIVGTDAHAREFRFAAGDPFVLEMVAPEYPAYVYVDYFDADGNVLHLVPNEYIALEPRAPDLAFPVAEALNITIGPPYGQEIAVAFAASRPLYDGLRPIQEPAAAYLAWLKDRVAAAREADPDFKGEWVYFFVTTRAAR